MSVDRRRTQPIMRWWCRENCTDPLCESYRDCRCSRWPAPTAPTWFDPDAEGLCCWGAWQAKGVANFAASLVDLTGQGHDLTPFCAIGWNRNVGWIFTGAEAMGTGFAPAEADQSQSMIAQFTGAVPGTTWLAGAQGGGDFFAISPAYTPAGNIRTYANTSGMAPGWGMAGSVQGNICVAGGFGYCDGILDTGPVGAGLAILQTVYLGALNAIGVPSNYITANVQAFAIYDCALDLFQAAKVAAAMAAL